LSDVSDRLSVNQQIIGRFTQARDVSFLNNALVSRGSFSIDPESGLHWLVEKPVRSQMQVRDEQVLLDGVVVADPGIGQFMAMILQAFVTRDLSPLAQQFEVSGEVGPAQWSLQLAPKQWFIRKAIERVELTGDQFLLSVTVYEPDGSVTRIAFEDVAGQSPVLKVHNGLES
jgi:hypothetical protein